MAIIKYKIVSKMLSSKNCFVENLWNFVNFFQVLPWLLAEMSSSTDWTPCSSSCGWTAIKSRTLTSDIESTDNLTTTDNGSMDNITTVTNESSTGSSINQFAFCKLNPCNGKLPNFFLFESVHKWALTRLFSHDRFFKAMLVLTKFSNKGVLSTKIYSLLEFSVKYWKIVSVKTVFGKTTCLWTSNVRFTSTVLIFKMFYKMLLKCISNLWLFFFF